jgi:hypothetical protein
MPSPSVKDKSFTTEDLDGKRIFELELFAGSKDRCDQNGQRLINKSLPFLRRAIRFDK